MNRVLIVDIGNTATEFAIFENDKMVNFLGFFKLPRDSEKLDQMLSENNAKGILPKEGMLFSVSPTSLTLVKKLLKKHTKSNFPVFDWKSFKLENKTDEITESIGADLLADIKAAEKFYPGSCLIADCGTITKLLLLDKTSKFLGISMIPGVETIIKSFNEHTAHLPSAEELVIPERKIPTNTFSSMCHGAYWSTISYIKSIFNKIKTEDMRLIITGGYSLIIKEEFKDAIIDQNLTLEGMYILYKEVTK